MLFVHIGSAQESQVSAIIRSDSTVAHNGELCLVHVIEQGQTLYSIAKAYDIFLSQLVFANPDAMDGIEPGMVLYVPKKDMSKTEKENEPAPMKVDGQHVLYEVPPKQTLYSISKEFGVSVGQLVDANPALKDGLKMGMTLRVPVKGVLDGVDEPVRLSGVKHRIAVLKDTTAPIEVLLLAPFYLDINDTIEAKRKFGEDEKIFRRSESALGFYQGMLIGLDSISKTDGHKFNIRVIDTDRSITKVERLLKQRDFVQPDVIVGPFFGQLFEPVARYGYRRCVPVISPTSRDLTDLNYNDHAIQVLPDKDACIMSLGEVVAKAPNTDNFLLVHYGNPEEVQLQWDFRKGLESTDADSLPNIVAVTLDSSTISTVKTHLLEDLPNHVVILTEDEANVAKLMRNMLGWLEDHEVIIYGPEKWGDYRNVDIEYFDQLRLHRPEVSFVEFELDTSVQMFNKLFRKKFEVEPSVFAFRGFDIAMGILPEVKKIREDGIEALNRVNYNGLQSDCRFGQDKHGHWINQRCAVVRINDLRLEVVE